MDFHALRLSTFEKQRLKAKTPSQAPSQPAKRARLDIDENNSSVRDIAASGTIRAQLLAGQEPLLRASAAELYSETATTGYALGYLPSEEIQEHLKPDLADSSVVVDIEGQIVVWRYGTAAAPALIFPSPVSGLAAAAFASPAPGLSEPGLVIVDAKAGHVDYWETVCSALMGAKNSSSGYVRLPLGSNEQVTHVRYVDPAGLVVATTRGALHLVVLRDSLGKRNLRTVCLRSGGPRLFSWVLGLGSEGGSAFGEIVGVTPGAALNSGERRLYIASARGDLGVWHAGRDGMTSQEADVAAGDLLVREIELLYPSAGTSLRVLDVAATPDDEVILLASFTPELGSELRYFVVAALEPSRGEHESSALSVTSVLRLQSYFTQTDEPARLQISAKTIFCVFSDAVVLVEPRRPENAGVGRWEEVLSLKEGTSILGVTSDAAGISVALSSGGIMTLAADPSAAHEPTAGGHTAFRNRLELAVFFGRAGNPLDLERWPSWSFGGPENVDRDALAVGHEIAGATSKYLPRRLPSLAAHLELRFTALTKLTKFILSRYPQASCTSELIQLVANVAAASAVWEAEEETQAKELAPFTAPEEPQEWFISGVGNASLLMSWLAQEYYSNQWPQAGQLLVNALVAADCAISSLGPEAQKLMQFDATVVRALEGLTHAAVAESSATKLAPLSELLCLAYAVNGAGRAAQADLLAELARLGEVDTAERIADRFRVWAALARIAGERWLRHEEGSREKIDLYFKHTEFVDALLLFLVSSGHSSAILELAPGHRQEIMKFLIAHDLQKVAWTLAADEPAKSRAEMLLGAAAVESSLHGRKLYASLAKLAAPTSPDTDRALSLIYAQQQLENVMATGNIRETPLTVPCWAELKQGSQLSATQAVDLLAWTEPASIHLPRAWSLVKADDVLRQRVLIQQLVAHTDWATLEQAATDAERQARARKSLWFQVVSRLPRAFAMRAEDSMLANELPAPAEVAEAYKNLILSDRDAILAQLENLAARVQAIYQQYNVNEWIQALSGVINRDRVEETGSADADESISVRAGSEMVEESVMILS